MKTEILPSNAFGIDVQNYGSDSELIYMIDISDLAPNDIEGERLITRKLGEGNYKIQNIEKSKHETVVKLIPL